MVRFNTKGNSKHLSNKTADTKHEQHLELAEGISEERETLFAIFKRRFKKHTLGKIGAAVLIILYFIAIFADFLSPYTMIWTDKRKSFHPPTPIHLFYSENGKRVFKPFVYEEKIKNIAFKKYAIVPEYTLRAISIEPLPGVNEMRVVATDSSASARKSRVMRAVARKYSLSYNSPVMKRLSKEIDKLQNSPQKDIVKEFVVGEKKIRNKPTKLKMLLVKGNKNFVGFFVKGVPYKFWGLFQTRVHFFGSPTGGYFMIGTDQMGRDVLSRLFHGSRISLSIGLLGVLISFSLGLLIGGIAGYFGGIVDILLMRFSEVIMSFPAIYLLFALRASFPPNLNSVQVYLLIVVILSFIGWAGLARIIRGMVLSLKNEEFVLSARAMGLSNLKIIVKHILANTVSYIIIQATISIPGYILGESALSLLGLGITDPQSSWGLMLSVARNTRVIRDFPWILTPGFFIFISIMAWNFFGDGIRDAVDPHSRHQ